MGLEYPNITLGTAGHIDHGKTALIKFLTGCDTDRLKAEKERGMSIELGFAPCRIADLEVGIVDVPGHENFINISDYLSFHPDVGMDDSEGTAAVGSSG